MSLLPGRLVVSQADSLVRLLLALACAAAGVSLRRDRGANRAVGKDSFCSRHDIIMLHCYDTSSQLES
jgi:hypothetical protein